MWIFGYGSLTWKADFQYKRRTVGYIKGYLRRFWQASIDHRGTSQDPGRVVTLIPASSEDIVWGAAYEVEDELLSEGSALNVREKSYQERKEETVYLKNGDTLPQKALVFLGTSEESLRLGDAPPLDIAMQIAHAKGPSGPNAQYLLNLAKFLHDEVKEYQDDHVMELETLVKEILRKKS